MIFICDKIQFQEAITIAQKAITGKSTMPILDGLYIEAKDNTLILIGSDKYGVDLKEHLKLYEEE